MLYNSLLIFAKQKIFWSLEHKERGSLTIQWSRDKFSRLSWVLSKVSLSLISLRFIRFSSGGWDNHGKKFGHVSAKPFMCWFGHKLYIMWTDPTMPCNVCRNVRRETGSQNHRPCDSHAYLTVIFPVSIFVPHQLHLVCLCPKNFWRVFFFFTKASLTNNYLACK